MLAAKSPLWKIWLILLRACETVAQDAASDARSLATAVQNINGASSILSLLPVLSGRAQNVKAIAARTFPGSLAILGVGAGRVLSKLQVGLMLLSADLYRNVVSDLSAYHQEYVNAFSPSLVHVPTGTPERHSSNTVVNHNLTEDYMVEAWFQTQGLPAKVELSQRNTRRLVCGLLVFVLMYTIETFLAVQNTATGTAVPLVVLQVASGLLWASAVCVLQAERGQGERYVFLNKLASTDYRCFQLNVSGKHVQSVVLSTQLSHIREYNLFGSKYESEWLKAVGAAAVLSGVIDVFTTFLVVGLNEWAYPWLGLQVLIIAIKVVFSVEPIRRIPIVEVQPLGDDVPVELPTVLTSLPQDQPRKTRLPITVASAPEYSFRAICIHQNVVFEHATQVYWLSRTPGLFIGQPYYMQRPKLPEKQTTSSASSVPGLAPMRVSSLRGGKQTADLEKTFMSPVTSPTSPPSAYKSPSSPSSESSRSTGSTVLPGFRTSDEIVELPRIVVSTASPVAVMPADLVAPPASSPMPPDTPITPPGIPLTRSVSSRTSIASRAPTPPAKSPARRAATLPSRPSRPATPVRNESQPSTPTRIPSRPSTPSRNPSLRATPPHPPRPPKPDRPPPPIPTDVPIIAPPKPKREPSASLPPSPDPIRYLALRDGRLTLSENEQRREPKEALQREFLACLGEVVNANKVPSAEFLQAIETTLEGIKRTMTETWYFFGTTDLLRYMRASYRDLLWYRYV
ncbi:transporter [Ganoderma sinense ZZ0214-1]|uniref:Transporter n=1 Tax=Ganoderma sinense ZZ0214-1 TaxID=1077348 RepID=A0A2G8RR71_9APHY|nr:transporter [Ganoderma sinense ZZ0214-1]